MTSPRHPYADLTPDRVIDALTEAGFDPDGRLLAMNSYENRVYQLWQAEGPPVVAKFYRPGRWSDAAILEEHAFARELAAQEIPAVPPLAGPDGTTLHRSGSFRFAVFPKRGGRAPELDDPSTLRRIGRFLGRLHAAGGRAPFTDRPRLDPETFGWEPLDWLAGHDALPHELLASWETTAEQAMLRVEACFDRAGDVRYRRIHGDCHVGNVLWTDEGPHFVDFDDSRSGPALQDLWMLLSGSREDMSQQLGVLLEGYEDFADLDRAELHLLEALRTLRLIHYAAWIARRWDDPAFPAAFPWFATPRYWQDRILELREQIALMEEPPLAV